MSVKPELPDFLAHPPGTALPTQPPSRQSLGSQYLVHYDAALALQLDGIGLNTIPADHSPLLSGLADIGLDQLAQAGNDNTYHHTLSPVPSQPIPHQLITRRNLEDTYLALISNHTPNESKSPVSRHRRPTNNPGLASLSLSLSRLNGQPWDTHHTMCYRSGKV